MEAIRSEPGAVTSGAPDTGTPSSTETNRRVAVQTIEALQRLDKEALLELLHPDMEWTVVGVGRMDRETLLSQFFAMLGTAKVQEMRVVGSVAEGAMVAIEAKGNYEFDDGRIYRNTYCQIFEIKAEKVISVREYMDTALAQSVFAPGG